MPNTKRALAPSFFCGALLGLLLASHSLRYGYWWLALCLLLALAVQPGKPRPACGVSGMALCAFGLWLLLNTLVLSPAFHAESVYFSAAFLIPFYFANRYADWLAEHGFRWFCGIVGLLSLWAVVQWLTGWGFLEAKAERAQALFSTPNTLATAINLALAPLLACYLLGRGNRKTYGLLLLLFAGLLASQSRGGYLGLIAALVFFMLYVGRATVVSHCQRYGQVLLGFFGVALCFKFYTWLGKASWSLDNVAATLSRGDSSSRWEIYRMVWPLLVEHFWQGIGYFNFGYYWQMHKVPPFLDGNTFFVHNDYLQLALETGVLGIGLLLTLIVSIYVQLARHRQAAVSQARLPLILAAAAVTSMLAHALVDFPFYIPALIAIFAAYVGLLDRQFVAMGSRAFGWPQGPKLGRLAIPGLRPRFVRGLALVLVMGWLGLPAFAEAAAALGLYRLQHGDARWGLYWHEMARSLQPRDAGYYWREGVIWRDQGLALHKAELIARSEAMFAAGVEVNPFEVNNLLERSALHRQHRHLLAQPAAPAAMLAWVMRAKQLQPYADGVQVEYVQVLAFVGQRAQAIEQAAALVKKRPQSKTARILWEEVRSGKT